MSPGRIVLGDVGGIVDETVGTFVGAAIGTAVIGTAIGSTVLHARRALGTTVRRSLGTPIGSAVVRARRALGTTICRSLGTAVGSAVVRAWRAFGTAVRRSFRCRVSHVCSSRLSRHQRVPPSTSSTPAMSRKSGGGAGPWAADG